MWPQSVAPGAIADWIESFMRISVPMFAQQSWKLSPRLTISTKQFSWLQ
jgi:hypothetical protein